MIKACTLLVRKLVMGSSSSLAWKAEVKGNSVTIQFGKVGTAGTTGCREFTTYEAAETFLAQRVRKKLEEGYKPEIK